MQHEDDRKVLDLKNGDHVAFKGKVYEIGELISIEPDESLIGCYKLMFEDSKGFMRRFIVDEECMIKI